MFSPDLPATPPGFRSGMVAVVGAANAGKSSLINRLVGEKVSIVSPVAQTTRNLVRGILTEDGFQLVFLDTPGMHKAKGELGKRMNRIARASTESGDSIMLVMDRGVPPVLEVEGWMRKLVEQPGPPAVFVLNKCDQIPNHADAYRQLWRGIVAETASTMEPLWMETSAETGSGTKALLDALVASLPEGPLLFPEETLSDFPRKLAIGDVIREKYFLRLHQELPHALAVWVENLEENPSEWKVEATVYVQRNSQKGMVIGNKGRLMKQVRGEAATELAAMYGVPIRLTLTIKVLADWDKNFWILRKLGYA